MVTRRTLGLSLLATMLCWSTASHAQTFDLDGWLDEPEVKLVAVEFYADWCEPCIDAVPRWEELRQRYADKGLKLVVVNTRSKRPGCPRLPWKPDESVCDPQGTLADSLGIDQLPSAFLWSWQGNLLVDRGQHVEEVEAAIQLYLDDSPRVQVNAKDANGALDPGLKRLFEAELSRTDKLTVVADDAMRQRLAKLRKESWDPTRTDRQRCKLGAEVSANSLLDITVQGDQVALMLVNAETGCQRGVFSRWDPARVDRSVARAVHRMLADIKTRPPKMPGHRATAQRQQEVVVRSVTQPLRKSWRPSAGVEVLVTFMSVPEGAAVQIDGTQVCEMTPCKRNVLPGPHRVDMVLDGHATLSRDVTLEKGQIVGWSLESTSATLSVTSTPPGASVSIDGVDAGVTPLSDWRVDEGEHRVQVGGRCHAMQEMVVTLPRGKSHTLELQMVPEPAGLKVLAVDDKGDAVEAEVRVDGVAVGRSPGLFQVEACTRDVTVVADDGRQWAHQVELAPRVTFELEANVEQDPKKIPLNDLLSTNKLGGSEAIANILDSNVDGFSNKIAVGMARKGSNSAPAKRKSRLGFSGTGTGGGGEGGYGRIHGMGKIDTGGGMGVAAGLGKKQNQRIGKIKIGSGATRGFCAKGHIKSVVRRRAGALRACYDKRLQSKPQLKGKIKVRWTIALDGKTSGVSVTSSTLGDTKVSNCVRRVIGRMRFRKPEGGICVVQWPFVFSPSDPAPAAQKKTPTK